MDKKESCRQKCYVVKFCDDSETDELYGSMIAIGYEAGRFYMVKVNWGAEEDYARSRDGIVEMNWFFNEENTMKLMQLMKVRTGRGLVGAMYRRFKRYAHIADFPITDFCNKKGVKFDYQVYF